MTRLQNITVATLLVPLDKESKNYVVTNMHKGLFKYTWLPFGISAAPGILQRAMDNILQGILGVVVYLDDILITGPMSHDHLQSLETVLDRQERQVYIHVSICHIRCN